MEYSLILTDTYTFTREGTDCQTWERALRFALHIYPPMCFALSVLTVLFLIKRMALHFTHLQFLLLVRFMPTVCLNCIELQITLTNFTFDNAQGIVWTGAVNQDWNQAANRNLNRVPAPSDQVFINICSTCPKLSNTMNVGALYLNSGSMINLDSYTLTVGGATIIHDSRIESNEGELHSSDFVEIKNSEFRGIVTLEKNGGSANTCYGGNTFSPALKLMNSSSSSWQVATQANNVIQNP